MTYDVAVIGAGPGGYIAAIRASQLGLKTCVIEMNPELGGTCLNVGCIPSKTLLHASEVYSKYQKQEAALDFPALMEYKREVVLLLTGSIKDIFKKQNIELFTGRATLMGPNLIRVNDKEIQAKSIIIASGSEPVALPFLPFDEKKVLSSSGALALKKVPKRMLVVGSGVIGVELASVYSRLGTEVTVIEMLPNICAGIDTKMASALYALLQKQKIKFILNAQVLSGKDLGSSGISLDVREEDGKTMHLTADHVLVAVGRRPNANDLGIDKLNIDQTIRGNIIVDKHFRTNVPSIYAIGDVVDGPMLAHKASYEGVAVAEIIAGMKPKLDYMTIPNVIYTAPELASVGLSEDEALELKWPLLIGKCAFRANPRARTSHDIDGFVKVIADQKTEKVIGLHILSSYASEMIAVGSLAILKRCTLSEVGDLPFAHPTYSEAIKEACLAALKRSYHL